MSNTLKEMGAVLLGIAILGVIFIGLAKLAELVL